MSETELQVLLKAVRDLAISVQLLAQAAHSPEAWERANSASMAVLSLVPVEQN